MKTGTGERLTVENFAGMKHVVLDIGKINLLIGPQATGKSVCAKLLYFFKNFDQQIVQSVVDGESMEELKGQIKAVFSNYFPQDSWPSGRFSVRYEANGSSFRISRSAGIKASLKLTCSPEFDHLHRTLLEHILGGRAVYDGKFRYDGTMLHGEATREDAAIRSQMGENRPVSQYFVPAGRSFFSVLRKRIFSLMASDSFNVMDPFLLSFGALYEHARDLSERTQSNSPPSGKNGGTDSLERLIREILSGSYMREDQEDFLVSEDGRKVRLANASSGQQEALPLALILRYLSVRPQQKGGALYVEEPEAHLFPKSQRSMVELLATLYNGSQNKALQLIVTTHSPYILTAFNNLIQAGILAQELRTKKKLAKLHRIVPAKYSLLPSDFSAYSLINGGADNLMDEKTGLILAKVIDQVSDDLAVDFDRLIELM